MDKITRANFNFNSIAHETLEELLVWNANLNFMWDSPTKLHFIALIIEKGNNIEECKRTLDNYLASTFGLDRGKRNRIESIDAYAQAKRKAMAILEEVHLWAKYKDMSWSKYGKRYIKKNGGDFVSFHTLIDMRRVIQATEEIPLIMDVHNIKGQLEDLKERLDFNRVLLKIGKMEEELAQYIEGSMTVPVMDSDGVQMIDLLGKPMVKTIRTEAHPSEIQNYQNTINVLRELVASGANKSSITSRDYQQSEKKLIDDINRQRENMKKRGLTYKGGSFG